MLASLFSILFLIPAYASDARKKPYSLTAAVVAPDGTMVPKFTVILRPRSTKPQLIRRLHFTDGIFELRNLEKGQYRIEISSPVYVGLAADVRFNDEKKPTEFRIFVMHPTREEQVVSTMSFQLKRTEPRPPTEAVTAYLRGVELHREGRLDEAMMQYGEAIRIHPDYVAALNDIGSIYITLDRPEAALAFLRRARRLDSEDLVVRMNMATALVNMRSYGDGIKIFEDIIKEYNGVSQVRYFLAKAYWDQRKYTLAESTIREALNEDPQMICGWVLLLNVAVAQQNADDARETLLHLKSMLNNDGFSKFVDMQMTALAATY